MKETRRIDLGRVGLLEFRGPDAVRFLNGQLTQDVRKVVGTGRSLPSCVTDAKGKLQFRVDLTESPDGALWVMAAMEAVDALEARLTRYLIADDVEVREAGGEYQLVHLIGAGVPVPEGVTVRKSARFGVEGWDWWAPAGQPSAIPEQARPLAGDELEAFRIANGAPTWGKELTEGLLPPEAGLDATDISYAKGCYIGQEVISRIKSAGKVNKRLARLRLDASVPAKAGDALWNGENEAGRLTSVSPWSEGEVRHALGYVKRGADPASLEVRLEEGARHPVAVEREG